MTQLILDNDGAAVVLPEAQKRGYKARRQAYHQDVKMVSQRLVRELGGMIWIVEYQYGFFDTDLKKAVLEACEKGMREPIVCGFLEPKSEGELNFSRFWVEDFKTPDFMWSVTRREDGIEVPVPMWADFSLTLREVEPSD